MTPRLYLALGLVAALIVGGLSLYAKGRIDARHAAETSLLRSQIKTLEEERAREEAARKADAIQAKTDREEAEIWFWRDASGRALPVRIEGDETSVLSTKGVL